MLFRSITGNHDTARDAAPARTPTLGGTTRLGGTTLAELAIAGLILRHEARAGETTPELSGHFHPRLRVITRGRSIARPCVVRSATKLILPAIGTLSGGMDAADPAILAALYPAREAEALVATAGKLLRFPVLRAA